MAGARKMWALDVEHCDRGKRRFSVPARASASRGRDGALVVRDCCCRMGQRFGSRAVVVVDGLRVWPNCFDTSRSSVETQSQQWNWSTQCASSERNAIWNAGEES